MTAQVAATAPHLVVDLSGLSFIDCSCLQVLWQVSRMPEAAGGSLRLAAPQPIVAWAMEVSGVDQLIGVHDSVTDAVIAAGGVSPAR